MDTKFIGYKWPEFEVQVERGQTVAFARGLGETNPVYLEKAAAKEAGYRDVPVLPTFPIALSQAQVEMIYDMLAKLDLDPSKILHANQKFIFHDVVCVGDQLVGEKRIENLYDKKNGALKFIETVIDYKSSDGSVVCEEHCTLVARS